MRYLALLPALALALVACSETPIPSEPESQAEQTQPLFSTAASSSRYTAIDLGTLGGSDSNAQGINDAGQVVGYSYTASGQRRAFLWDAANGMQDLLGTLGGSSGAEGINDAGQVVGYSYTASGPYRAFLWDAANGMQDLGTLGGSGSYARGINDAGQVVGWSGTGGPFFDSRAFLWDAANGMQDLLGTLGGSNSNASGINDAGQVVGHGHTASGPYRAFLWDAANGMQDLGTLGGTYSDAYGINDAGQVVGWDGGGGPYRAFLWDAANGMQDLGTLGGSGSYARGINDAGQVVGSSSTVPPGGAHAFLWDAANGMQDLGTLGGTYSDANGINDAGQVVGYSYTASGSYHATLWRVLTPLEKLEQCAELAADLEAQGVLNKGQAHSFVNKINLATAALNDGKNTPGLNKLEAFQNEARGYVNGGKITAEQGEELISCVQDVIDAF